MRILILAANLLRYFVSTPQGRLTIEPTSTVSKEEIKRKGKENEGQKRAKRSGPLTSQRTIHRRCKYIVNSRQWVKERKKSAMHMNISQIIVIRVSLPKGKQLTSKERKSCSEGSTQERICSHGGCRDWTVRINKKSEYSLESPNDADSKKD